MISFKEFFLLEKGTTSYGCLMAVFSREIGKRFTKFAKEHIDKENLYEDGIEDEAHTTVLYGFEGDLGKQIKSLLSKWGTLEIELGKISRFSNDERDVIKVEVKSEDIKKLHSFLMEHYKDKITTDFPKWNGHITLAYVKSGAHKELDGNDTFKGDTYTFDELVYSPPGMKGKVKFKICED